MVTRRELDKEYSLTPVPLTDRLTLIATIVLWAGLTLDPSAPYLASWWGSSFPFATFIAGTLIANIVLSVFSTLSGYMASREGLTYALATERVYGKLGAVIPSLWAGAVCIGWLAFSIGVVVDGFIYMLNLPVDTYYVLVVLLTILFSTTAYLGVRHIIKLSYVATPLLLVLIVAGAALGVSKSSMFNPGLIDINSLPLVFGLVLGTFVNGSIVLSFDYQRFCRKPLDAAYTGFINFLGFWTAIIVLAGIPAAVMGKDLYGVYVELGLLPLAVMTLFLLAWTSADNQLYSASLSWAVSLKTMGKITSRRKLVLAGAILTIILAVLKLHTFALQWLSLLTSISLPAGVVLWVDYYVKSKMNLEDSPRKWNIYAFTAWALGSIVIYYLYVLQGLWYGVLVGFAATLLIYLITPSSKH